MPLSGGAIVGIVVGIIILGLVLAWFFLCMRKGKPLCGSTDGIKKWFKNLFGKLNPKNWFKKK